MTKKTNTLITKKSPSLYPTKTKVQITVTFFAILAFYLFSMYWTQNQMVGGFGSSIGNVKLVIEKFFPPNMSIVPNILGPLAQTIQMAIIATTIAAILTIPLAFLSAQNITTSKWLYTLTRIFLNIFRTIPDLVLAIIFVGLFGVGLFSGILALIIFSLGILAKLMSETIEATDMRPFEAMRATGGNIIQVISFGLVPQILPQFMSFVLYVFEINVRASIVLGLVGAGGIGLVLNRELQFYNYPNAMTIIIIIFIIVIVIELISNRLRKAMI